MALRLKFIFLIAVSFLVLWFFYIERAILSPFIFAAIFAYIFNPIVNFLHKKAKIPRTFSVIVIYVLIIGIIIAVGISSSKRIVDESSELETQAFAIVKSVKYQINNLPDWIQPIVADATTSFEKSTIISYSSVFSFFPKAFSGMINFIIFLFAAFYLLKEGGGMVDKLLKFAPNKYKIEVEILFKRINAVLGGYLRGQIFLVILVSTVLFILLAILGVKFALLLAIFSGFAEIVPIIGPLFAVSVAAIVAFAAGTSNFGLPPLQIALIVVVIYFVVRQIQDYSINPYVMGKITKLHPLIILFAVLAGEHMAGIVGLILAVPIAGVIKIIFEYSLGFINDKEIQEKHR